MRVKLEFEPCSERLRLPLHYNSEIQGFIYRNLDRAISDWVHNEGVPLGKRRFRFFTFSRLLGKYRIEGERIEFTGPVQVHIGSVHEQILESLVKHLLMEEVVWLGKERCELLRVEVEETPKIGGPVLVRTLSPITVYSTLIGGDGRKKTYYYTPMEKDWEEQLLASLRRKAQALGWGEKQLASLGGAHIRPVRVGKQDLRIVKYRETVIKAWTGIYEVALPEPFFLLAYDSGLGSKNSQGFGMVEVVDAAAT
ncbi:CRISPR-associated endoribonuclease Cas6 [Candidatus Bipolaricaulota bacterium]|nr:CRISPR-associated endoribonuclease Cas6 [Candidatus Bipolaricaulota bacterium]